MARSPLALVTGGNRGLGLETCRQLAERGHHVILTSRKLEDAERAAGELGGKVRVEPQALDVTDPESVRALAAAAPSCAGDSPIPTSLAKSSWSS